MMPPSTAARGEKTIFLVRHGECEPAGLVLGQFDAPLSKKGIQQAEEIAAKLAAEPVERVVASVLRRSFDTALRIARPHGIGPQRDARLNEITYGAWDGLAWEQIETRHPQTAKRKLAAWWSVTPPGGESAADFYRRVEAAWRQWMAAPERCLAVAGHAAVNAVLADLARRAEAAADPGPGWEQIASFEQEHGGILRLTVSTQ